MGKMCRMAPIQAPAALEGPFLQPSVSSSVWKDVLLGQGLSILLGEKNTLGGTWRQAKRTPEEKAMGAWQTCTRMEKLASRLLVQTPTELGSGRREILTRNFNFNWLVSFGF